MAHSEPQHNSSIARVISLSVGFSLMLAWHYLILFSPVFGDIGSMTNGENEFLFARQLSLYITLAASFTAFLVYGKWRMRRQESSRRHKIIRIYVIGVLSLAVGALYVMSPYLELPLPVRLALIGVLGMLQAAMMVIWMRCLMEQHDGSVLSTFGIYMISGGAIAIIVCYFQWPISLIAAVVLPFLSSILLAHLKITAPTQEQDEQDDSADMPAKEPLHEDKLTKTRNIRLILFAGIFAFTFGLLQGSFIVVNIPILIVNNAVVLIGIICAGLIIHLLPKNASAILAVDLMHRYSVILFITGAIVIMWYNIGSLPMAISQIALLAGFNLFDFGLFVFGIEGNWSLKKQPSGCDLARPVVYLSMSLGLLIGYLILKLIQCDQTFETLLVICGACVIMVIATTLTPVLRHDSSRIGMSDEGLEGRDEMSGASPAMMSLASFPTSTSTLEDLEARPVSPWKNACREIAKQYKLSPRETEIFFLIARGRNADYIQKELVISPHTAKTHIANIYHKLDVHSAQELLDRVEECKAARRRS